MEKTVFTWSGWDQQDVMAFTFYDVEVVGNIPGFPKGTKFDGADVDYGSGELSFYNLGDEDENGHRKITQEYKFKLSFVVSVE